MRTDLEARRATIGAGLAALLVGACSPPAPDAPDPVPHGPQWFAEIAREVGIDFRHESGASGALYMPEIMGGGVGLFDADGDGDLDAFFVNQNRLLPAIARSTEDTSRLYLQRGDGTFEDATARAGLGHGGFGMGVATGDIDNDGDVDVLVTGLGPAALYRNRGDGAFEDATAAAGIDVGGWSSSATFFDYDRDGFLDLYVARYLVWEPSKRCASAAGRRDYCGPTAFPPERDVLLHNRGDGRFEDVSDRAGIRGVAAAGLGVVSDDFDDDGWPDLYVANDGYANLLWINQGDGTFTDEAVVQGAAYNARGVAEAGMGVVAGDFDGDGKSDVFVTNLDRETNTLYRNLGGERGFSDVTEAVGVGLGCWNRTGFGTVALDAELDGDLDLFIANGRVTFGERQDGARLPAPWDELAEPNLFYLNDGTGRFALAEEGVESLVGSIDVGRGAALGDVDADGDPDLLLGAIHGAARLYRNDAPRRGRPLAVRAVDPRWRRDAIGARVTLVTDRRRQARTITAGFSYLSTSPPVAYFGVPEGERVERIEIRWPDGTHEAFPAAEGPALVLVRGAGSP
jgi:hypothetical protein